jgi:hypothetical protein
VNARQRKLGFQAQNRCIEIIALTEKKIGEELVRGQEEGRLLPPGRPRGKDNGRDANHYPPATIAELGLTKQKNRDFKAMAPVPAGQGAGRADGDGAPARGCFPIMYAPDSFLTYFFNLAVVMRMKVAKSCNYAIKI